MATHEEIVAILRERFSDLAIDAKPLLEKSARPTGQYSIALPAGRLVEVLRFLRDDERTCFEQLIDLTCVDYLHFDGAADRYGVIYSLLSLRHGHRLWVKSFVNDPSPSLPTVTGLWHAAEWMEREVFDMFGIRFEGHPDLRRILTWEGFEAHPLRKDYPLRGRGERENYQVVERDTA